MIDVLDKFKPKSNKTNNILCIIEGQTELKYILYIFRKYIEIRCKELIDEFVIVRWGKGITKVKNYCEFDGGSQKDSPVPFPVLEAFEFERDNLENYFAIIIMFDSDEDKNQIVEKTLIQKLKNINTKHILLVSRPCFESTLLDYCQCKECRNEIEKYPQTKKPCEKYKNNFSKLNCFNGVDDLIVNISDYKTTNQTLLEIDDIIFRVVEKKDL